MSNVLLGTAIGDALGVPFEKFAFDRKELKEWDGKTYLGSEHHKLLPGQYSDDTQMSLMVAESLIENKGFNPDDLSQRYVHWITSGIARGYGRTTLAALQKIESGTHWSESGVVGSYGNGTAMRAAPFGIFFRNDLQGLKEAVRIDNNITHASDEAEAGALTIAIASYMCINGDTEDMIVRIAEQLPKTKIRRSLMALETVLRLPVTPMQVLQTFGTKADVRETVPSAMYCFSKFGDAYSGILAAIRAGGDADTTAAIVGALYGASNNLDSIPESVLKNVEDRDRLIELDSQLLNRDNDSFLIR